MTSKCFTNYSYLFWSKFVLSQCTFQVVVVGEMRQAKNSTHMCCAYFWGWGGGGGGGGHMPLGPIHLVGMYGPYNPLKRKSRRIDAGCSQKFIYCRMPVKPCSNEGAHTWRHSIILWPMQRTNRTEEGSRNIIFTCGFF